MYDRVFFYDREERDYSKIRTVSKFVDYYTLLDIPVDASQREVRSAYLKLAKEQHPDKGGSHEVMQLLNKGYETLSSPIKRAAYDKIHRLEAHAISANYTYHGGNASSGGVSGQHMSDDEIDDFISSVFAEYAIKTPEPALHKKASKAVRDYLRSIKQVKKSK